MLNWQKSSYSASGNACLEIAAAGRKSSYSAHDNNRIGPAPGATGATRIHLRESDQPGAVLTTSPARLSALLGAAKAGALGLGRTR